MSLKTSLLALLLLSGPAWAEPPSDADIRTLLKLSGSEEMVPAMQNQVQAMFKDIGQAPPGAAALNPAQKQIAARFQQELVALTFEEISWAKMEPFMFTIYREFFTADEVRAQIDFYRSPGGQAMVRKMPQVMERSVLFGQQAMQRVMPKIDVLSKKFSYEMAAAADPQ